ncbi:MAG TPA: LON peptidase substrate-binding domain-containing protein [Candidatus Polarisedimenticolia bacterium]|nr:LON peptidase substrate-binding domain-containing protein [Candidatus Polarisedimenticolia bacterium]
MEDLQAAAERLQTRTTIAIFPLPNVVFFPGTSLGLHIFEPRYRSLVAEVLESDRLMAVALLQPGWEQDYYGTPPVHPIAGAGVIEEHQRLPDGRFNLRLRGLGRVRITGFAQDRPYRIATIDPLPERDERAAPEHEGDRRRLLAVGAGLLHELAGAAGRPLAIPHDLPFALGVNLMCQSLSMDVGERQRLLEMDDVSTRGTALLEILRARWQDESLRRGGDGPAH